MLSLFRPASLFFRFANSPALLAIGGLPYLHDSGQNINFVALSRVRSLLSLFYLIPVFFSPSLSLFCLSERGPRSSDIKPFRDGLNTGDVLGVSAMGTARIFSITQSRVYIMWSGQRHFGALAFQ